MIMYSGMFSRLHERYSNIVPEKRATLWCFTIFLFGAAADIIARFIFSIYETPNINMTYNIFIGNAVCSFAMCLTSAVIVDQIFFHKTSSSTMMLALYTIFILSAVAVAMTNCGFQAKEHSLTVPYSLLSASAIVTWMAKVRLYRAEFTIGSSKRKATNTKIK